jgi:hypothetical protein
MYSVLSISQNTRLLLERNDTLAMAGFRVISPRIPEQAPILAVQQDVDAIIVGHSVEDRGPLIEVLRRVCPGCLIVFVYTAPMKTGEPLADISVDVTHGNNPLIAALQERLPREAAAD